MKKEKVFIILSHVHSLKPRSRTEWQVTETVEFVTQVKRKHNQTASAICDYINEKMILGARVGMSDYEGFINYVKNKYPKEMERLGELYPKEEKVSPDANLIKDQFGNVREKNVFDVS